MFGWEREVTEREIKRKGGESARAEDAVEVNPSCSEIEHGYKFMLSIFIRYIVFLVCAVIWNSFLMSGERALDKQETTTKNTPATLNVQHTNQTVLQVNKNMKIDC